MDNCKIVVIVSQKAHNVRLFLSEEEVAIVFHKHYYITSEFALAAL